MTPLHKMIAATMLFSAWGALVLMGETSADGFVVALRDALLALGVFTAALSNPKE